MVRKPLNYFFIMVSLLCARVGFANNATSLTVKEDNYSGSFFAGFEYAQLTTSIESLSGYGLQIGYRYVLTHRWCVDASLSQIYGSGAGAGFSALYSGINASVRYAPFTEFSQRRREVLYEGRRVFEETSENNRSLAVGLQMNQLLLNGTTSVYNATGLGLVVSYDMTLWSYHVRPELRYGSLSANNEDMTAVIGNFLVSF